MAILVEPSGAKVLYFTTRSCGHQWSKDLLAINSPIRLDELRKIGAGSEAFGNLEAYAKKHQLQKLDQEAIVRYFATEHIEDANRSVRFSPQLDTPANRFVGNLVANCVLWFPESPVVMNLAGREISITGTEDFGGEGVLCLHRRGLFRLPLPEELVASLKRDQEESTFFLATLDTLRGELSLPLVP